MRESAELETEESENCAGGYEEDTEPVEMAEEGWWWTWTGQTVSEMMRYAANKSLVTYEFLVSMLERSKLSAQRLSEPTES